MSLQSNAVAEAAEGLIDAVRLEMQTTPDNKILQELKDAVLKNNELLAAQTEATKALLAAQTKAAKEQSKERALEWAINHCQGIILANPHHNECSPITGHYYDLRGVLFKMRRGEPAILPRKMRLPMYEEYDDTYEEYDDTKDRIDAIVEGIHNMTGTKPRVEEENGEFVLYYN